MLRGGVKGTVFTPPPPGSAKRLRAPADNFGLAFVELDLATEKATPIRPFVINENSAKAPSIPQDVAAHLLLRLYSSVGCGFVPWDSVEQPLHPGGWYLLRSIPRSFRGQF